MTLFKKKQAARDLGGEAPPEGKTSAEGVHWAGGSLLGSKAVTVLVVAAVCCGPVALIAAQSSSRIPVATHATEHGPSTSVLQQSAGAFALGYVTSWLGASSKDPGNLGDYVSMSQATLSQAPFTFRRAAVSSLSVLPDEQMVTVIVAADVEEEQISGKGAAWRRRYFEAHISTAHNHLAAVGLPAPVTGPAASTSTPALAYDVTLSPTSKAATTVTLFLSAYLAGQGETEPYVSPSSRIPAITPAPFAQVQAQTYLADDQPSSSPADGSTVDVLATAVLENQVGQKLTATYSLQLRARAGRWEVSRIESVPTQSHPSPSGATPPSPSSTTKGK